MGQPQRATPPKHLSCGLITGTSFGPSVFYHDGSILQPAGWYDAGGVLNNSFPLQPGKAYIFFITAGKSCAMASGSSLCALTWFQMDHLASTRKKLASRIRVRSEPLGFGELAGQIGHQRQRDRRVSAGPYFIDSIGRAGPAQARQPLIPARQVQLKGHIRRQRIGAHDLFAGILIASASGSSSGP